MVGGVTVQETIVWEFGEIIQETPLQWGGEQIHIFGGSQLGGLKMEHSAVSVGPHGTGETLRSVDK